uniref:Uncharacterized protein n=1 Tax=Arundo donax TaxID=35708 RepID=A0A0A9AM71_ARUDO
MVGLPCGLAHPGPSDGER